MARRKGRDIEIVKEVFRRQAKAKEKIPYIKGQKNTITRSNRYQRGPVDEIEVNITKDELNK
jgi:hypothetical protein